MQSDVVQRNLDVSEEHIPFFFKVDSCSAFSSNLKSEIICSSETLTSIRTTERYKPGDPTLHTFVGFRNLPVVQVADAASRDVQVDRVRESAAANLTVATWRIIR